MSTKSLAKNALLDRIWLENIISHIPQYIFWKDTNLVYLGCNELFARTCGFQDPAEIVGKTDYDLKWLNFGAESYRQEDKEVLSGNQILDKEVTLITPNNKKRIISVSKVPLQDISKKIIGVLGIYTDITERKQHEKELIKAKNLAEIANKAKTEFLYNMRHDIRTPLTGIIGFAELIKKESNNPKIAEYADNMLASSQTLLDFMNEILETIQATTGEIPLYKKKFDLKAKLQSIINLNQAKAQEKNLTLSFHYDPMLTRYFIGDPNRIHKIVLELVSNALNFTHKGEVRIEIQEAKTSEKEVIIRINVSDTGIGIPKDKREDIFMRFNRLHPSYKGIYKGAV